MNENVTNKSPKRRRWIARLLVSALCILLASSLLFVGVVADVGVLTLRSSSFINLPVGTGTYLPLDYDFFVFSRENTLYFYRDDFLISEYNIPNSVSGYIPPSGTDNGTYTLAFDDLNSILYAVSQYGTQLRIITLVIRDYQVISSSFASYGGLQYREYFVPPLAVHNRHLYFIDNYNNFYHFYNGDLDNLGSVSNITWFGSAPLRYAGSCYVDGYCYFPDASVIVDVNGNYSAACPNHPIFAVDGSACYVLGNFIRAIDPVSGSPSAIYEFYDFSWPGPFFGFSNSSTLTLLTRESGTKTYHLGLFTFPSSPPESSDETTTEPPPESSEPGEPGTLNIYRTDIDRSGGVMVFNSTLYTSIPSDGLESLSAYLGYYWDVDSSVQPPPSYMYLLASYEDGTRQRYDFDFSAYGYALGSDFAQNFYYPDYLGMEFEIPLNGETDIYFVTSSPGGSVTVENSDGRIITLNFGSTSSYARIDFVDELNYRITLYNNDMAIGNSLTFDQGVYRYFFVYNVDSAVNTWYYPEPGSFTLINYDKVENGLYNVVLTLNDKIPDYGKPGDFENAVSWYEEIEGAVSSTMSETWEYLESLQEELNGSFDIVEFSEANAKLDQILSTPGGDTIFTFFKSLWGINPLLPTFAVMTVCFAGVAFIIRKI